MVQDGRLDVVLALPRVHTHAPIVTLPRIPKVRWQTKVDTVYRTVGGNTSGRSHCVQHGHAGVALCTARPRRGRTVYSMATQGCTRVQKQGTKHRREAPRIGLTVCTSDADRTVACPPMEWPTIPTPRSQSTAMAAGRAALDLSLTQSMTLSCSW